MRPAKYVLFVIAVAALAALALHAGMAEVLRTLAVLGWGGFAVVTLLHVPVIVAMGLAWWSAGQGVAAPSSFVAARWVRDSVGEVLPFSQIGGYLSGVRALSLGGARLVSAALSMLADLVAEFGAKLPYVLTAILALMALLRGDYLVQPMIAALILIVAGAVLVFLFRARLIAAFENAASRMMRKWIPGERDVRLNLAGYFSRDSFVPDFTIHLIAWFYGALEAWVTFRLMGIKITGVEALVIDSLGTSLRALGFMVPAAAGVQEAGYVLVSLLFGIAPAQGIAFSLTRRARDLAIGLPGLVLWQFLEAKAFRSLSVTTPP